MVILTLFNLSTIHEAIGRAMGKVAAAWAALGPQDGVRHDLAPPVDPLGLVDTFLWSLLTSFAIQLQSSG